LQRARRKVNRGNSNIGDYREVLEPYYNLSKQTVGITEKHKPYYKTKPFKRFSDGRRKDRRPDWWIAHTKVKHDRFANLEHATLKNVAESLAGLFLLNVIHIKGRLYAIIEGTMRHTVRNNILMDLGTRDKPFIELMKRFPDPRKMKAEFTADGEKFIVGGTIWIRSRYFSFIYKH